MHRTDRDVLDVWTRFVALAVGVLVPTVLLLGCGSGDHSAPVLPARALSATLKNALPRHDVYYALATEASSLEIAFDGRLDARSVPGNIDLQDKSGSLADVFHLDVEDASVFLRFQEGFQLRPGWLYVVSISEDVRAVDGRHVEKASTIQVRTAAANPLAEAPAAGNATVSERTAIVCFSDVHMGEERAVDRGYCWFGENAEALQDFVDHVRASGSIRELVILGDLFDEWLIPFGTRPFEGLVSDSRSYFRAVRQAATNAPILDTLADISRGGEISVIYVRGNHDMLTDAATLEELLPGIVFRGQDRGLGSYAPVDGVIMEHGHRYDFFNAPHPLVNPDHILPPGYFVSRMWAAGMEAASEQTGALPDEATERGPFGDEEFTFPLAWDAALIYSEAQFPALVPPLLDDPVVLMTGVDGYGSAFSFQGAKTMYVGGDIETHWPATQAAHGVEAPMPVAVSILSGHSDLFVEAQVEYLENEERGIRIVMFGHTHESMLEVFPAGANHTAIYANTGSWINEASAGYLGGSTHKVRTFVVVTPAAWTGSDLDVVTLYQYDLSTDGTTYEAVRVAEESLIVGGS